MKHIVLTAILLFTSWQLYSQTRHVLLEEFTGAHCGICPNGAYYVDSMLAQYPNNLIAVSLHSYGNYDAMNFPEIDTINAAYATGAPLGAVDRICPTPPSDNTAQYITQWDANIQQRLQVTPTLAVSITPTWTSSSRLINALVSVNITAAMANGDYRISLYVVEDSVTGVGAGYDQSNSYNTFTGSHWYGLGDPIVGYVHRHVARALLPSPWGQTGIIPFSPVVSQTYSTAFNYTLPSAYDETKVYLVAVVSSFTSTHTGDEVLNAEEVKLLTGPAGIASSIIESSFTIAPNPGNTNIQVSVPAVLSNDFALCVYDCTGRCVLLYDFFLKPDCCGIDVSSWKSGVYFIRMKDENYSFTEIFVKE